MGPRIGRFDKHGSLVAMPGHSVPLSALGGLILILGFFACNGAKQVTSPESLIPDANIPMSCFGFQGSISNLGDGITVTRAIVNTALGTSAAGISTLMFNKVGIIPGTGSNYSFMTTMNGSLTGSRT